MTEGWTDSGKHTQGRPSWRTALGARPRPVKSTAERVNARYSRRRSTGALMDSGAAESPSYPQVLEIVPETVGGVGGVVRRDRRARGPTRKQPQRRLPTCSKQQPVA